MEVFYLPFLSSWAFLRSEGVKQSWKTSQLLAQEFWKCWRKIYLPTLIPLKKWHIEFKNVKEGELILLKTPGMVKKTSGYGEE